VHLVKNKIKTSFAEGLGRSQWGKVRLRGVLLVTNAGIVEHAATPFEQMFDVFLQYHL